MPRQLIAKLVAGIASDVTLILWLALVITSCGTIRNRADAGTRRELEQLRAATAAFRQLDNAVAAGYPRTVADCLVHEHHGAMGFHHVNPQYVDGKLALDKPEILLYEREADGTYKLNGVEFIVPYRAWPRDSVAPVLMGEQLKHEDNLKIWYLHVWAWSDNADGVFADFNPSVQCSPETRNVFRPSSGS